jgi:cytochrome b6-f complex iron-sulfur subunit
MQPTAASNKPKNDNGTPADQRPPDRRTFITRLWAGLGLLAMAEFISVGLAFFRRGKTAADSDEDSPPINCGSVAQFAPGSVTAFVRGRFYLVRLPDDGFLAISRQCTHMGCSVPWDDQGRRFACPCHASSFDITGAVVNSPAPRALDIYPLTIENDIIRVNVQTPIRRNGFDKSQAVYPKAT